jgi:hypothetical protein
LLISKPSSTARAVRIVAGLAAVILSYVLPSAPISYWNNSVEVTQMGAASP